MSKVEDLLASNPDYCVVGNSPCEIGKKRGRLIDKHDLIIRFNDFSLDKKFKVDYGTKTNIWVRGTNDKLVYTFKKKKKIFHRFDLIVIRARDPRNKDSRKYFETHDLDYDCYPLKYELELTSLLGACPSTGLLTLFIISKIHGKIDPRRMYGFSFCKENREKSAKGGQVHYYNRNNLVNPNTGKVERIKKTFIGSKHDWRREEIFFRSKLMERK